MLISYFESHNLLTAGNLASGSIDQKLVREVIQDFENKYLAQTTLCDCSKAFDSFDKKDLANKLFHHSLGLLPVSFIYSLEGTPLHASRANPNLKKKNAVKL